MGEISERDEVLQHVLSQYDRSGKGELTALEVQQLHGDLRMGGISYPQVLASIKYVCATDHCTKSELHDLLQEMDRRYYLVQDLRWEFTLLDREQKDTITAEQARWMVQAVHGKNFSRRKWADFLRKRSVPGSRVAFPEIEVLLCNVKSSLDCVLDREEEERERQDRLRREKLAEEEARLEQERLRKLKEDERRRKVEDNKRQEENARRRMMEEEELRRRERERLEEEERLREEQRLRDLEEQRRLEEAQRQKEEEEKYRDVEKYAAEFEKREREYEEELKRIRKKKLEATDEKTRKEAEQEEMILMHKHKEVKHKRIRYGLKVAMKTRDRYELEYSIKEFKKEDVKDEDMELQKAEKLLKELVSGDNLRRAISKRELHEIENAIEVIKRNGLEVQMARELMEANKLVARLRKIQRIRSEILELKQSTVAEIRSYQNPPPVVHRVMTATFLILGHAERETKDWKAVQALVGKTGKESLKRRCLECNAAKVNLDFAKRSQQILDSLDLDEVRDVSAGAATFYVFSVAMVEEAFDLQLNPPPAEPDTPHSTPTPPPTTITASVTRARTRTQPAGTQPAGRQRSQGRTQPGTRRK